MTFQSIIQYVDAAAILLLQGIVVHLKSIR